MTARSPGTVSSPLRIILIDADPVFRLGLHICLESFADLEIVAEASSFATALTTLASVVPPSEEAAPWTADEAPVAPVVSVAPTLVLLDANFGDPEHLSGQTLFQQLKTHYPTLPVLLLTGLQDTALLTAALQWGIEGYRPKGTEISELVQAMRQVATGERSWNPTVVETLLQALTPTSAPSQPPTRRRSVGQQELEATLASLQAQLQLPNLTWFERAFLAGRRREVLAARWVVNQLFPPAPAPTVKINVAPPAPEATETPAAQSALTPTLPTDLAIAPSTEITAARFRGLKSLLLESVLAKLSHNLTNQTGEPLEIDILRSEKKRELFYIGLRRFEEILDELQFSQVKPLQLAEQRSLILQDLWQATTSDFFGKYYTLELPRTSSAQAMSDVAIVNVLLRDAVMVRSEVLDKIPLVLELLEHLLFQTPLMVENVVYPPGSPEAVLQASALLENLLIQIANATIQPLLNHFADVETIKQNFYDRRLISTREIERFRNALSWKYRLRNLVNEPKDMFQSQFSLVVFRESGLKKLAIYAPREQELKQLQGIPLFVTLALETRDAVASPLRSTITFIGQGVIYLLTQVVGRGIGLIGRGIIQGIGSSWQDVQYGRKQQKRSQEKENF